MGVRDGEGDIDMKDEEIVMNAEEFFGHADYDSSPKTTGLVGRKKEKDDALFEQVKSRMINRIKEVM